MNNKDALAAYFATLATLTIVYLATLTAGSLAPSIMSHISDFAFGTLVGGLIGVLKAPTTRSGGVSDATAQSLTDKIPPVTTDGASTDPATPAG